jgi:hypothetical protein
VAGVAGSDDPLRPEYFYPDAACTPETCELNIGFISSPDGGANWGSSTALVGPMRLADIAPTSQGPMVGDYISTSFNIAGTATTAFAIGSPHTGSVFDEDIFAPTSTLPVASAAQATRPATSTGAAAG